MRTTDEIRVRLDALKSRQKDGLDLRSEIAPLILALNTDGFTETEIKIYICNCVAEDDLKSAQSAMWLLTN